MTLQAKKPAFAQADVSLLRECITFYLNKNDFELTANSSIEFVPTELNARKKEQLINLIHRLGRI